MKGARETTGDLERHGLHVWWEAAGYAAAGVRFAWRSQRNFRIEVACAALAILTASVLEAPLAPILLACALVLSLELVNTALEAVVDLVSPEYHPLAKTAKDAAAGAVLLAAVFSFLLALVEFVPRLVTRLGEL